MSGPLIYIGTYSIKGGKLEECKQRLGELVDLVETNEPRLIAFHIYLDEQGSKISVVQVHPDSDSMEFHLKVVSEHLTGAFEYLETTESECLYGAPSDTLAEMLRAYAEPGVPVTFMPVHEIGFTRASVH
jgi:predicted metallo-beta-lactamase superfamily hydrolase